MLSGVIRHALLFVNPIASDYPEARVDDGATST